MNNADGRMGERAGIGARAPQREPRSGSIQPEIFDLQELLDAAAKAVLECLGERGFSTGDLDGWLCSGLGANVDEALRRRLHVTAPILSEPHTDDGYWCAAAEPALIAEVLDQAFSGRIRHGSLLLSWGASFDGVVSAQLWRVVTTDV